MYLAKDFFFESSGACPLPPTIAKVVVHQDVFHPITTLFRSIKHPTQEYTSTKHRVDQVSSANEAAYWLTIGTGNTVPMVVVAPVVAGSGSGSIVRSGSTEASKEREANEWLAVSLGLVFAHPVLNVDKKNDESFPCGIHRRDGGGIRDGNQGGGSGSYDDGEHVFVRRGSFEGAGLP